MHGMHWGPNNKGCSPLAFCGVRIRESPYQCCRGSLVCTGDQLYAVVLTPPLHALRYATSTSRCNNRPCTFRRAEKDFEAFKTKKYVYILSKDPYSYNDAYYFCFNKGYDLLPNDDKVHYGEEAAAACCVHAHARALFLPTFFPTWTKANSWAGRCPIEPQRRRRLWHKNHA